jgi:hypothetical protein
VTPYLLSCLLEHWIRNVITGRLHFCSKCPTSKWYFCGSTLWLDRPLSLRHLWLSGSAYVYIMQGSNLLWIQINAPCEVSVSQRFLPNVNLVDTLSAHSPVWNFIIILSVGNQFFRAGREADGRTELIKLVVAFYNSFPNAHKIVFEKIPLKYFYNWIKWLEETASFSRKYKKCKYP